MDVITNPDKVCPRSGCGKVHNRKSDYCSQKCYNADYKERTQANLVCNRKESKLKRSKAERYAAIIAQYGVKGASVGSTDGPEIIKATKF